VQLFDRTGRMPVLTEAGRALAGDARAVISGAAELKARARSIADDIEPELSFAVDAILPKAPLIATLSALRQEFPLLTVALYTEALGAVESLVLEGKCSLGISALLSRADDRLKRRYLTEVEMIPVTAAGHPLAQLDGMISLMELQRHTQLVLTDRSPLTEGFSGGVVSRHIWRFVDLETKQAFLRAGFGWGGMPSHMVEEDLAAARLKRILVAGWDRVPRHLPLSVVQQRGRRPGRAARWLLDRLDAALNPAPGPAA
jgi:DNA-binding transcriptional LysR family regulator